MTQPHSSESHRLKVYERRYRRLTARLADVGFIWRGSVVRQLVKCGKSNCACRDDENRRHGPYYYWSTKVRGKTVSRLLNPEEAKLYERWIENRRQLEKIQREMIAISEQVARLLLGQAVSDPPSPRKRSTERKG